MGNRSVPQPNLLRRTVRFLLGSGSASGEDRREALLECSRVVGEMPREVLQRLTERTVPITPQESFLSHFEGAVPRHGFETFRLRFAEIFCSLGPEHWADAGEFWGRFEVLFGGMEGSRREGEKIPDDLKMLISGTKGHLFRIFGASE